MMTAQPIPQLDLFEHSRDTMLRNDVLDALLKRDAGAATLAWQALADFEPRHQGLPALAGLIGCAIGLIIFSIAAITLHSFEKSGMWHSMGTIMEVAAIICGAGILGIGGYKLYRTFGGKSLKTA